MKRIITLCAVCAAVLAVSSCGSKDAAKVTAVVNGPDAVVALVVDYGQPIDSASVTPDAYKVEGKEIVCAKVVEENKVVVKFKGNCPPKHECEKAKPECEKAKAECADAKAEGDKKPCCKEGKPAPCPEGEPKPECKDGKAEIPVPDIAIQQVKDIKAKDGKKIAAWKKAIKATEAKPACHKGHGHHGDKPCCKEGKPGCGDKHPCDKPEDQKCDDCKAAAAAEKAE